MSLLAVSRSFSPEPLKSIYDDDFDNDFFAYIQSPPTFDFFGSPKVPDEMSVNHPHHHPLEHTQQDEASIKTETEREKEDAEGEDVSMTTSLEDQNVAGPFRMQHLHIDESSTQQDQNQIHATPHHQQQQQQQQHQPIDLFANMYQPYNLSASYSEAATSTPIHQYHFHPYNNPRDYSNAMRNRSPASPIRPMSPPLSVSPPGSALSNSPNLVSPMNLTSPLSDTSPASLGFHYQLPFTGSSLSSLQQGHGHGSMANVSPPTGPGMSMVSGFPYPTLSMNQQSPMMGGKAARPKVGRTATRGGKRSTGPSTVAGGSKDEDDDSDFDDGDGVGQGGLGFSPTMQEGDDRIPISNKREDIRKARIESEQGADKSKRRRDELREGFKRLKEVLPHTTQRSSKASLLDRSVAHIQSIEAANRYLLAQLETANRELEKLRHTNTELVHAVATNSRGSNSNSPHGRQ